MATDNGQNGLTPEQMMGIAGATAVGVAGLTVGLVRRRRRKKDTLAARAEELKRNPALQKMLQSAGEALDRVDGKRIDEARRELANQSASLRSDYEPMAREMADRARETATRVRAEGRGRSKELGKRWQKEFAPAAKTWADEAVHEAEQILDIARERANEFGDTARKDYIPKLAPLAASASGALATTLSDGAERVSDILKDGSSKRKALRKELGRTKSLKRSPSVAEQVGAQIKNVIGQIVMISFWGAALGAVVYYGLLDEERRERVRSFVTNTYSQMSDLINDFQDDGGQITREGERF